MSKLPWNFVRWPGKLFIYEFLLLSDAEPPPKQMRTSPHSQSAEQPDSNYGDKLLNATVKG